MAIFGRVHHVVAIDLGDARTLQVRDVDEGDAELLARGIVIEREALECGFETILEVRIVGFAQRIAAGDVAIGAGADADATEQRRCRHAGEQANECVTVSPHDGPECTIAFTRLATRGPAVRVRMTRLLACVCQRPSRRRGPCASGPAAP